MSIRPDESNYHAIYGYPLRYIENPLTGSSRAFYRGGVSFEVGLPCCDHCDDPLDDHGYCVACETRSDSYGVHADWSAIGRRFNEGMHDA